MEVGLYLASQVHRSQASVGVHKVNLEARFTGMGLKHGFMCAVLVPRVSGASLVLEWAWILRCFPRIWISVGQPVAWVHEYFLGTCVYRGGHGTGVSLEFVRPFLGWPWSLVLQEPVWWLGPQGLAWSLCKCGLTWAWGRATVCVHGGQPCTEWGSLCQAWCWVHSEVRHLLCSLSPTWKISLSRLSYVDPVMLCAGKGEVKRVVYHGPSCPP